VLLPTLNYNLLKFSKGWWEKEEKGDGGLDKCIGTI